MTHFEQQPGDLSPGCEDSPLMPPPGPGGYDISLLYLRISRTMSKKALSTLIRDLAEVSMKAQPNRRANSSPSISVVTAQR